MLQTRETVNDFFYFCFRFSQFSLLSQIQRPYLSDHVLKVPRFSKIKIQLQKLLELSSVFLMKLSSRFLHFQPQSRVIDVFLYFIFDRTSQFSYQPSFDLLLITQHFQEQKVYNQVLFLGFDVVFLNEPHVYLLKKLDRYLLFQQAQKRFLDVLGDVIASSSLLNWTLLLLNHLFFDLDLDFQSFAKLSNLGLNGQRSKVLLSLQTKIFKQGCIQP